MREEIFLLFRCALPRSIFSALRKYCNKSIAQSQRFTAIFRLCKTFRRIILKIGFKILIFFILYGVFSKIFRRFDPLVRILHFTIDFGDFFRSFQHFLVDSRG